MSQRITALLFLFAVLAVTSCERPGKGGRATVHVHIFNDSKIVPYATVHVRYGGTGFPGASAQYQDSKLSDYSGEATFEKLRKGDYYFYVTAIDSSTANFDDMAGGAYVDVDNRNGERHIVVDLGETDPF